MYTLSGDYYGLNGNASAWTQIANSTAIPLMNSAATIIPVQDFTTVSMGADDLRSFYITMKGPFLDSLATAMETRGSVDRDFDAFRLDVGGGLSEYKFPAAFDETVHPKFAGAIHYQESTTCGPPTETLTTTVEFDFLLDVYEFDETIFKDVATVVNDILESALAQSDGLLKEAVGNSNLLLVEDPRSALPSRPLRKSLKLRLVCVAILMRIQI